MAVQGEIQKNPVGRPPKLTPEEKSEVLEAFKLYIERTPDPTIVGFVSYDSVPLNYWVTDDDIDNWGVKDAHEVDGFYALRKRAVKKQEAFLIQAGGIGRYNPTMAIFRLKQPTHGYKDRTETDVTSGGERIGSSVSDEQLAQLAAARAERTNT